MSEAAAGLGTIVVLNRDLFFGFRERMVVTLIRPTGRAAVLMHTVPGELGGTGLNEHGVALFANSLWARSGRNWMASPLLRRKFNPKALTLESMKEEQEKQWPRIQDLPEEEREPFTKFLDGQTRPLVEGDEPHDRYCH